MGFSHLSDGHSEQITEKKSYFYTSKCLNNKLLYEYNSQH